MILNVLDFMLGKSAAKKLDMILPQGAVRPKGKKNIHVYWTRIMAHREECNVRKKSDP